MRGQRNKQKHRVVYIAGESPLVEEYAVCCAKRNFAVTMQGTRESRGELKSVRRSQIVPRSATVGIELTNSDLDQKKKNLQRLDKGLGPSGIILSSSITVTLAEQASWIQHPQRLVGICALPTLLSNSLIEFSAGPATEKSSLLKAQEFFMNLGKQVSVVQDRVGMVLPRILCMIINEAYFALQERIASPQDVDIAMKLGTNYPCGPVEWGENLRLQQVSAVLRALQNDMGGDRYRVAPLLKQMAQSQLSPR